MASSLGKIPTTSVLRLISPLRRSIGFVKGVRALVLMPAAVYTIAAYAASIRDKCTGSTKVRAGWCIR